MLYRSSECGCSGVRTGWFMSCFWLQTDVEGCQIDCCLIITVWRVCHCDGDYTHTHTHTPVYIQRLVKASPVIATHSFRQTAKIHTDTETHKIHFHTKTQQTHNKHKRICKKTPNTESLYKQALTHSVSRAYTRDSR